MEGSRDVARNLMDLTKNNMRQRGQLLSTDLSLENPRSESLVRDRLASVYNFDFVQLYSLEGSLVFETTRDAGVPAPGALSNLDPRREFLEDGRFKGMRFGLDADVMDAELRDCIPMRELCFRLLETAAPAAADLGTESHLSVFREMVERGNGACYQRRVFDELQLFGFVVLHPRQERRVLHLGRQSHHAILDPRPVHPRLERLAVFPTAPHSPHACLHKRA